MKMFYKLRNFTQLAIYSPQASRIYYFLTLPETGLVSTMWPPCSMIFRNTGGKLKIGLDQSKGCMSTAFNSSETPASLPPWDTGIEEVQPQYTERTKKVSWNLLFMLCINVR